MKNKKILLIIVLLLLNINITKASNIKTNEINIYIFHSKTCSHCKEELKLINKLEKKYNNLNIHKYEISNKNNKELYNKVTNNYKIKTKGVPLTIIGDKYFIGYNETKTKNTFIKTIIYYSNHGYIDKTSDILNVKKVNKLKIDDNNNDIDKFIKEYGNYKVLNINTDSQDIDTNNILLTSLTEINIFNILLIIILIFLLSKIKNIKTKLLLLITYIIIYLFENIIFLLELNIIIKITNLIAINYLVYSILYYIVKDNNKYIINSIIILLSILNTYIKINYNSKYLYYLKDIIELNTINLFEKTIQILINIISVLIINLILIIVLKKISDKIINRYKKVTLN